MVRPAPGGAVADPRVSGPVRRLAVLGLRIALLAGVVWLVWHELRSVNFRIAREQIESASGISLLWALLATGAAIVIMGLYDVLAFPSAPGLGPARRWRLGMLFFAWTNFLTLGPIGGPAIRLYFYRKAGLDPGEIVRGLTRMYAGMFGGLGAWVVASVIPLGYGPAMLAIRVMIALCLAPLVSVAAGRLIQRFRPVGHFAPRAVTFAKLGLVGALDWAAAMACFVFVGRGLSIAVDVTDQLRTLFIGQLTGLLSMMPGGIGSADAVWLKLLTGYGEGPSTAAAHILLFRSIFYIVPWAVSLVGLYVFFSGRAPWMIRWQRRLLAGAIGINAALLLASAAMPAIALRLRVVQEFVPVNAADVSHAVAVAAAAVMLFLIRGILRGYRAAFIVAGATLAASVAAHTIKGGDTAEAIASMAMLVLLLGARRAFTRRGRIPIGWELTLGAALGSLAFFIVVGLSVIPRRNLDQHLWDRILHHTEAMRFARGIALIAGIGLVFMLRQAVMPRRIAAAATEEEIDAAINLIASRAPRATALNVGSGDKCVWFWKADGGDTSDPAAADGLAVYQTHGGKLVIFSDPIVDDPLADEFLDDLHAMAADQDRDLVFYQLTPDWMQHLHDFGYTFFKLGEEAVVPVAGFTLQGGAAHGYRKSIRRVEAQGVTFEVVHPPFDQALIDEARAVSDAWLAHKGIQEMQFSLGYFSPEYMQRFPLAIVRGQGSGMVGFMNLLAARPTGSAARPAPSGEVTSDLMRYIPGIDMLMDFMVIKVMVWAAENGYATLNLGMCPLYDVGEYRKASIPERLARLLFEHGERIYNYRGLHAFKDKFRPVWEPRYMAYQRPWDWPSAVITTTALIWGRSPKDRQRIGRARGVSPQPPASASPPR